MVKDIEKALEILSQDGLIAMPTETVYGLAGDATSDLACARIFETKNRPSFNPLIAHMADLDMARDYVVFSPLAMELATKFWPAPLTLVLPKVEKSRLSDLTSAGLATQAVRIPNHPIARDLLRRFNKPLAAPSANRSGHISPTTAQHVRNSLGTQTPYILDAGPCAIGVESTIVKIDGDDLFLLRAGGIAREEIEALIGQPLQDPGSPIQAPGMMISHYAPIVPIRLEASHKVENEVFLGFGDVSGTGKKDLNLSPTRDLTHAAANLFAYLHQLEKTGCPIAVAPIPKQGLGHAINDRLNRAAAPRSE